MRVDDFILKLEDCTKLKTLYVKGGIGRPLTEDNKKKCIEAYAYNKKPDRKKMIMAATSDTFSLDCIGLGKAIGWGFSGDKNKALGGAVYCSNNIPDVTELGMLKLCSNISTNMEEILPGEFLWLQGHCGYYIGNGEVTECSPAWKNGVQITKLSQRKWMKHGLLPFVEYGIKREHPVIAKPTLRIGSRGFEVDRLQADLNFCLGSALAVDGIFGPLTFEAVKVFQKLNGLSIDGIYGPKTYNKMREVLG